MQADDGSRSPAFPFQSFGEKGSSCLMSALMAIHRLYGNATQVVSGVMDQGLCSRAVREQTPPAAVADSPSPPSNQRAMQRWANRRCSQAGGVSQTASPVTEQGEPWRRVRPPR
ncbi:hypothetical protein NDU88_000924 [Pleurodeles waltl]|uniref:Uncharacterized protein n=1 Tax=Pleurodeles waltl TaxID=8319 RepID=A0AAV7TIP0_PLEWA|nr:hypothetical protein NDU88_000924 [Pleurodeles waltl]